MALLKSQVYSGNVAGAIKVINAIPNRRMRLLPAIVIGILLYPFRVIGRIIGLGLKQK